MVPHTFERARRGTKIFGHVTALVAATVVIAASFFGTTTEASNQLCTGRRFATGNHTIQKFFVAAGWGWTNWPVRASVWADDDCLQGKGEITVSVTLPQSSVDHKGGQLTSAAYVRYIDKRTNAVGGWIQLRQTHQLGRTFTFKAPNGQYISMNQNTRILSVAINTAAWTKQDASGWIALGNGWVYCNMWLTTTGSPGRCQGD